MDILSEEQIDFQLKTLELEEDLFEFVLWVFEVIYKRPFKVNWHHRIVCKILMDIYFGKLLHTIITIPPRYTKTEIIVKIFPAWCFAKRSTSHFLHLAYSDALAHDNSSAVKSIIESVEFQERWHVPLRKDTTAKKKWKTETDGEFSATAAGGSVTGFGAGIFGSKEFGGALIVDDPLKPDDAKSDTLRNNVNFRFPDTIKSRLNDRRTPMIIVMQRLHEDDPVGFLLGGGTELEFTHINLPAINEDGPSEYDPRNIGEALWPDKHTEEELEQMRLNLYFKVHSWDFTFKKSKTSDFVVGSNWGKRKSNKDIYLIDLLRKKMSFSESLQAIKQFAILHPDFNAVLVEDKANGSAIIDSIKGIIKKVIPIIPSGSKEERAEAQAPLWDAGDIWLPHPSIAPWIEDFVNEHKVFPNGKHDDQVDSGTQATEYLDKIGSGGSMKEANQAQKPFRKTFGRKKARKSTLKSGNINT
jgi:predicted phage terminase large subunit-like protein